jgi:hypothetical protein
MLFKKITSFILIVLVSLQIANAQQSFGEKRNFLTNLLHSKQSKHKDLTPEPQWETLKHKEIQIKTKETGMKSSEMYSKVLECVQKCLKQRQFKSSFRDNCVRETCSIY